MKLKSLGFVAAAGLAALVGSCKNAETPNPIQYEEVSSLVFSNQIQSCQYAHFPAEHLDVIHSCFGWVVDSSAVLTIDNSHITHYNKKEPAAAVSIVREAPMGPISEVYFYSKHKEIGCIRNDGSPVSSAFMWLADRIWDDACETLKCDEIYKRWENKQFDTIVL